MNTGKAIENIIIFGGIGAMAYLLLKKKPVVEQQATKKIFLNGVEIKNKDYDEELVKLCSESIGRVGNVQGAEWKNTSDELLRKCFALEERNELNEDLVDQSILSVNSNIKNNDDLYLWDFNIEKKIFYTPSGELRANNCTEIDLILKDANDRFKYYNLLSGSGLIDQYKKSIEIIKKVIADAEAKYNKFNCRDKIEAVRTRNLIDLQTKGAIKAEESIVNKGFAEQKTYIVLGSLILLTSLYVFVKK
jgi:hypothetical protein